jgi:hypothetical protein
VLTVFSIVYATSKLDAVMGPPSEREAKWLSPYTMVKRDCEGRPQAYVYRRRCALGRARIPDLLAARVAACGPNIVSCVMLRATAIAIVMMNVSLVPELFRARALQRRRKNKFVAGGEGFSEALEKCHEVAQKAQPQAESGVSG